MDNKEFKRTAAAAKSGDADDSGYVSERSTSAAYRGRHAAQHAAHMQNVNKTHAAARNAAGTVRAGFSVRTAALIAIAVLIIGGAAVGIALHGSGQISDEAAGIEETYSQTAEQEITEPVSDPENGEETEAIITDAPEISEDSHEPDYAAIYGEFINENYSSVQDGYFNNYALYDMDLDGIPELIIQTGTCEADVNRDAFTISRDTLSVVDLGSLGYGHSYLCPYSEGPGLLWSYGQMGCEEIYFCSLENGVLNQVQLVSRELPPGVDYISFEALPTYAMDDPDGLNWDGNPADNNGALLP